MGNPSPYEASKGDAALVMDEPDRSLWRDTDWDNLTEYETASAMDAICDHLDCTLQSRIEPGKGKVWRLSPKP